MYIRDLRGLKVYEKDEYIGEILRAEIIAGRELYLIKLPDGKELLLPCTAEFIKTIDMQDRKMQVVCREIGRASCREKYRSRLSPYH